MIELVAKMYPLPWRVEPASQSDSCAIIVADNDGVICRLSDDGADVGLAEHIVECVNQHSHS